MQVWMAVARKWMVERAEKAAEATRDIQHASIMHGDTFHPLPLTGATLKVLHCKPLATDTAVAKWIECQANPCMASHAVYAAGYGRFLALEEEGAAAYADGMLSSVHWHFFPGKEQQGSMEPEGLLAGSLLRCIKDTFAAFQVRRIMHRP
jgi:hypothetical protein